MDLLRTNITFILRLEANGPGLKKRRNVVKGDVYVGKLNKPLQPGEGIERQRSRKNQEKTSYARAWPMN